jgi:hypothetical protein
MNETPLFVFYGVLILGAGIYGLFVPPPVAMSHVSVLGMAALPAVAADAAKAPEVSYRSVAIEGVPHVLKRPDFGGEACAAMFLQKLGLPADQDYVFDQSGLDPLLARGCHSNDLVTALERIGLRLGPVFYQVVAADADRQMAAQWRALYQDLAAGIPSIVCMRETARADAAERFRLVLGYDQRTDEVLYHNPDVAGAAYRRLKRADFLALWALKHDPRQWTLVRLRLDPGRLKAGRAAKTFTAADYCQHMMVLGKKIPAKGFSVVIQPPFVVIGDEPAERVKGRAESTVRWAVDKLKAAYFTKDPVEILDIWLFKDDESYRKNTKLIFNYEPDTPYGYFSDRDKALVMNIRTGGGTLVHEIVHPFIAANFPNCPSWLNEGLGSLYEQSDERDGRIIGRTNWRLRGLQEAIRGGKVPSFKTLCSTTTHEFYYKDKGTNYAQARYLCYYLQEQGLLRKYYHQFVAGQEKDPSGYETLKAILDRDEKGMDQFKKEWEAYVLKLKFP